MKKVFAILMCLVMVVAFMPAIAWADGETPQPGVIYQPKWDDNGNPIKGEAVSEEGLSVDNTVCWYQDMRVGDSTGEHSNISDLNVTVTRGTDPVNELKFVYENEDSYVQNDLIGIYGDLDGYFGIENMIGMLDVEEDTEFNVQVNWTKDNTPYQASTKLIVKNNGSRLSEVTGREVEGTDTVDVIWSQKDITSSGGVYEIPYDKNLNVVKNYLITQPGAGVLNYIGTVSSTDNLPFLSQISMEYVEARNENVQKDYTLLSVDFSKITADDLNKEYTLSFKPEDKNAEPTIVKVKFVEETELKTDKLYCIYSDDAVITDGNLKINGIYSALTELNMELLQSSNFYFAKLDENDCLKPVDVTLVDEFNTFTIGSATDEKDNTIDNAYNLTANKVGSAIVKEENGTSRLNVESLWPSLGFYYEKGRTAEGYMDDNFSYWLAKESHDDEKSFYVIMENDNEYSNLKLKLKDLDENDEWIDVTEDFRNRGVTIGECDTTSVEGCAVWEIKVASTYKTQTVGYGDGVNVTVYDNEDDYINNRRCYIHGSDRILNSNLLSWIDMGLENNKDLSIDENTKAITSDEERDIESYDELNGIVNELGEEVCFIVSNEEGKAFAVQPEVISGNDVISLTRSSKGDYIYDVAYNAVGQAILKATFKEKDYFMFVTVSDESTGTDALGAYVSGDHTGSIYNTEKVCPSITMNPSGGIWIYLGSEKDGHFSKLTNTSPISQAEFTLEWGNGETNKLSYNDFETNDYPFAGKPQAGFYIAAQNKLIYDGGYAFLFMYDTRANSFNPDNVPTEILASWTVDGVEHNASIAIDMSFPEKIIQGIFEQNSTLIYGDGFQPTKTSEGTVFKIPYYEGGIKVAEKRTYIYSDPVYGAMHLISALPAQENSVISPAPFEVTSGTAEYTPFAIDFDKIPAGGEGEQSYTLTFSNKAEGGTNKTVVLKLVPSLEGGTEEPPAEKTLTRLEVTNVPQKTEYIHGDSFDKAGMVVKATYSDGTTNDNFTDYEVAYAAEGQSYLKNNDKKVVIKSGSVTEEVTGITVGQKQLSITELAATDREYDGTKNVTLSGGQLAGVVAGETVTVTMPTSGTVADANAGTDKPVTITKPELTGTDAVNYTLADITEVTVNINKAKITVAAKNQEIYVDGTVPDLTSPKKDQHYTVKGLADGEVLGGTIVLEYQKDGNKVYPDAKSRGTYDIVISGVSAPNTKNYEETVELEHGTLTIMPKSSTGGGVGGGGGGGGGAPAAPAEKPSAEPTQSGNTTTTDMSGSTVSKGGQTTTTVDKQAADKLVETAVANKSEEIVISAVTKNQSAASGTKSSEVALPADTLQTIAEKTNADIVIKTNVAEVKLDNKAAEAVASQAQTGTAGKNETVSIVAEKVKEEAKEVRIELKVVTSGGAVISDFKGGNATVTVNVPKSLSNKNIVCVYIDENGYMHKMDGRLNSDGTYSFTTGHFSTYAIMSEEEVNEAIKEQKEAVKALKLKLRSELIKRTNGKKAVKLTWSNPSDIELDGVEIYRSLKKNSGYGKKPIYVSRSGMYINTAVKPGKKYYYKVRGFVTIDGEKVYTDYSFKAYRTVK